MIQQRAQVLSGRMRPAAAQAPSLPHPVQPPNYAQQNHPDLTRMRRYEHPSLQKKILPMQRAMALRSMQGPKGSGF